jgi:hypothetical protein
MTNDFQGLEAPRGRTADAILLGLVAAVATTIAWAGILHLTDSEYLLAALGVGSVIGLAVRAGVRGRPTVGHRCLAAALAYASMLAGKLIYLASLDGVDATAFEWLYVALVFPFVAFKVSFEQAIWNLLFSGLAMHLAWRAAGSTAAAADDDG